MKKMSKKVKKAKKEMKAEGEKSKPRLDKFARGGGVKRPHKTQVNVIVGGNKQPVPVPVPPMAGPPMAPPGLPTGARPPIPGMKNGGKVPHMTAGSGGGEGRLQKTEIQKNKK